MCLRVISQTLQLYISRTILAAIAPREKQSLFSPFLFLPLYGPRFDYYPCSNLLYDWIAFGDGESFIEHGAGWDIYKQHEINSCGRWT